MINQLIRSVDGKHFPAIDEVSVYWPLSGLTQVYEEEGFVFDSEPCDFGVDIEYPVLLEFDYRSAAYGMLLLLEDVATIPVLQGTPVMGRINGVLSKVKGK